MVAEMHVRRHNGFGAVLNGLNVSNVQRLLPSSIWGLSEFVKNLMTF